MSKKHTTDEWDNLPALGSIHECPKCGVEYSKSKFCRVISYHDGIGSKYVGGLFFGGFESVYGKEHICIRCELCGYRWEEACKNAIDN